MEPHGQHVCCRVSLGLDPYTPPDLHLKSVWTIHCLSASRQKVIAQTVGVLQGMQRTCSTILAAPLSAAPPSVISHAAMQQQRQHKLMPTLSRQTACSLCVVSCNSCEQCRAFAASNSLNVWRWHKPIRSPIQLSANMASYYGYMFGISSSNSGEAGPIAL